MKRTPATKAPPWTPLQRGTIGLRPGWTLDQMVDTLARTSGLPEGEVRDQLLREFDPQRVQIYRNDVYTVMLRSHPACGVLPQGAWLSIRRNDRQPVGTAQRWRDFQRIKNELLGEECEAVELYPAESRLHDGANQYHLWGSRSPEFRFLFGMDGRMVSGPVDGMPWQQS